MAAFSLIPIVQHLSSLRSIDYNAIISLIYVGSQFTLEDGNLQLWETWQKVVGRKDFYTPMACSIEVNGKFAIDFNKLNS